jgi:16S rRNA G1207 methylase RsmC
MREKKKGIDQALIFNPGQGHVPVALWKLFSPFRMTLVDRDLLSLRAAERNLLANGCPREKFTLLHKPGLPAGEASIYDLILGALHDSEGPAAHYIVIEQAAALLVLQGEVLVSGSSTTITRLEKSIKEAKLLTVKQRRRNRAKRMLWLSKQ